MWSLEVVVALLASSLAASAAAASYSEEVTCGRLYYRTLHLDERNDALYVGAMDRLMRFDARNVSRTDCEAGSMHIEATAVAECVGKGRLHSPPSQFLFFICTLPPTTFHQKCHFMEVVLTSNQFVAFFCYPGLCARGLQGERHTPSVITRLEPGPFW